MKNILISYLLIKGRKLIIYFLFSFHQNGLFVFKGPKLQVNYQRTHVKGKIKSELNKFTRPFPACENVKIIQWKEVILRKVMMLAI